MIYFNGTPFKNPELSDKILFDSKQKVRRAYSGNIYSFRLREQRGFILSFKDMPYSQAQLMLAYLKEPTPFTYIDYNNVSQSVRCIDETISFSLDNAGHRVTDINCTPGVDDWVSFEINLEVVQS